MPPNLRVLMVTSEWPTPQHPHYAPFVVRQVDHIRKAGAEVDVLPFRGSRNPLNYWNAWRAIQDKVNQQSYDLIHAQWGQSGLPAIILKRLPLVVTFRGSDLEGILAADGQYTRYGKVLQAVSHLVAYCADQVIVVSPRLGRLLRRQDYHVIPSGIDVDLFQPIQRDKARRELLLPLEQPIVFFGGNPAMAEKRFGLAQQAMAIVEKLHEVKFLVAQDIPHERMPLFMNASDVLLLTSSHEGSPNMVKEALACNLPVVSTDVGDVRERIGKIPGCVVCVDDHPETIAAGLAQVLSARQRVQGRETVLDLDERLLTQKVIQVYQKALGNK